MGSKRCILPLMLLVQLFLMGNASTTDNPTTLENSNPTTEQTSETTEVTMTTSTSTENDTLDLNTTESVTTTSIDTTAYSEATSISKAEVTTTKDGDISTSSIDTTYQPSSESWTSTADNVPTTSTESLITQTPQNTDTSEAGTSPTIAEVTKSEESTTVAEESTTVAAGGNPQDGGDESVVVMLGCLLALFMILFLAVFLYEISRRRKLGYAQRAGEQAYDNTEMTYGGTTLHDIAADGIEKIRETDIRVITDPLGEGRFGDIFPGQLQRGTRKVDVAFKTLKPGSSDLERGGFMGQLGLYNRLEPHPHLIQFYGLCAVGDQMFAAFEYASNGNLRNFLRRNGMPESESASPVLRLNRTLLLNFAYESSLGMQHLSSKKIVHREVMSRHVLLTAECTCKLAGLNETQRNEENYHIRWMAPESLHTGRFTLKSDVWAFGVLLWEIITLGGQPYPDIASKELPVLLQQEYIMPRPENCEPMVYEIMKLCWDSEPELRPDFDVLASKIKGAMETSEDVANEMAIDIEGLDD